MFNLELVCLRKMEYLEVFKNELLDCFIRFFRFILIGRLYSIAIYYLFLIKLS